MPTGSHCIDCPHAGLGQRFIGPDGGGSSGILLVGDSPWKDEIAAGRPFAGSAGRLLDRILSLMPGGGMQRADLTVANTIWCRPSYLGWMDKPHRDAVVAIEHCRPNLDELIYARKPKVIVPMGNVALRRVCGVSGIEERAGYVLPTPYGIPAVPTYHPAYLQRGKQSLIPVVLWALQRAGQIADATFTPSVYSLLVDAAPESVRDYLESSGRTIPSLFVDIETPESANLDEEELEEKGPSFTIVRAGFSVRAGTACSFPWEEPYIGIMREALSRAEEVVEWADNHYDTRRLAAAGLPMPAKIVSAMWAWHWLQSDLRKGLGLVAPFFYAGPPWKHLNVAEPGRYNALDNAIGNDCYIGTRQALLNQGRWEAFERHCVQFDPVLQRMGRKGLRVNREYQQAFMDQLEAEWDVENAKVQALVPDEVRKVKLWKRPPKDMTGVELIDDRVRREEPSFGSETPPLERPVSTLPFDGPMKREVLKGAARTLEGLLDELEGEHQEVAASAVRRLKGAATPFRYLRREPFNVDSWQQVQTLAKHLGITLPKRDTDKETDEEALATDKKTLSKYVKKYPVFKHILACRERWKLVSTYKWPLDAEDRVHYAFTFAPSTWRLSCRSQNLQTIPKRSDLAKRFRRMIVASPAHKLVEADACVDPSSKILRSDLTWVRADAVQVGDELIGFDENSQNHDRKFRASKVVRTSCLEMPKVRVYTTHGDVVVSSEHPFLARYNSYKRRWVKAIALRPGVQISFLTAPWEFDSSRDGGYLAGFFDGEGWCTKTKVGYGQNLGPTFDRVQDLLHQRDFHFGLDRASGGVRPGKTQMHGELSTMQESLRFLGSIRPPRLLAKSRAVWEGRRTWGKRTPVVKVLAVEKLSNGPVVAIETTTKTYISDGMFSHNSAIEAVLVGHFAGSARLIRLARSGVHGWLTSALHGTPVPLDLDDTELSRRCKAAKKLWPEDYEKMKRVVHLSNYLGTKRRIHEEYPDDFPSERDAGKLQQFYLGTDVGADIRAWQKSTVELAHASKALDNGFGLRHRFYSLYAWNARRSAWEFGDDAKRAVAFRPQSAAAAIQRIVVLRLIERMPECLEWLCLLVHDAIIADVPDDWVDRYAQTLYETMLEPVRELSGLTIGAEVTVGENAAPFDATENLGGMREWHSG